MATAATLLNQLPENLYNAIQTSIHDADIPPQGTKILRHVASCELRGEELDSEFLSVAARHIDDWVSVQAPIQQLASVVLEALDEAEPVDGEGSFPAWRVSEWGKTLMFPWSENLLDAVAEANLYLASNGESA